MAIDNSLVLRLIQESCIGIHPLFIRAEVNRRNLHIPPKVIIPSDT
jgi:hypothetical protein